MKPPPRRRTPAGRIGSLPRRFQPMPRSLIAATALAGVMTLGGPAGATEALKVVKVAFTATPAPTTMVEMAVGYSTSSALITTADGRTVTVPFAPDVLWQSGDRIGGHPVGVVVDKAGRPIPRSSANKAGAVAQGPFISPGQDANSLLVGPGGKLHLVTHLEYVAEAPHVDPTKPRVNTYGLLPAMMHVTEVRQDPKTGTLTAIKVSNVDAGGIGGIWIPCNGSTTPWNTHLGGEEYEPNARFYETRALEPMNLYLGTPGKLAREGGANPYAYGHPIEVSIGRDGKAQAVKRYAMGRLSVELFEVMPDRRTAYAGDDGRDTMMLMFVADKAGNLTAGTLYAARWEQTSAEGAGTANLSWVRLGHATEAEVAAMIARRLLFSDIFDTTDAVGAKADPSFTPIHVYPGYDLEGGKPRLEYLRVRPGMDKAAAFLETRRYAALLGATTEFTKMEGLALDAKGKTLFTAMSYIEQGMLEGKNDKRPADHVHLAGDPADLVCGAVYATSLAGGRADTSGAAIASDWVGTSATAAVVGARKPRDQTAYGTL
ncbi:MAG: DUF839 domain-containing protein, partial [Magnetospirillum sp.]